MSNSWQEKEDSGQKGFNKTVFETLWMSYRPYLRAVIFVFILGFIGRFLILANANMIGKYIDAGHGLSQIKDLIWHLTLFASTGFLLTIIFRIRFSRLSAQAISTIYDEVTLRTSRFPMSFF